MDEQENVTQAETTAPESLPETESPEVSEEPSAGTTTEPEHSQAVPYERFKEVNDQLRELKDMVGRYQPQPAQPQYEVPQADPDTDAYVDYRAEQKAREMFERQEQSKFEAKHAKDFEKDPLLRGAFIVEVQDMMAKGRYVDRETALEQAKKTIDSREKAAAGVAKQEGVKQGQDIARTKQQLGAVGETQKQPESDPSKMSAAEYAKTHNIPRV